MWRFFIGLLLALGSIGAAWSAPTSNFGAYHAIVIGNNDYADLPNLKTAANDARSIASLLQSAYGFNVQLLINATRGDIIGSLAEVRGELGANDNLLVYFAGHGVLDSYAEEGYWLPVNAGQDNPANWISNDDITKMVKAIRAKHVMVVADSCFSGTLVRAAPVKIKTAEERDAWFERMHKKRSRTAMVSGGLEPVIDSGGGGNSVFAKAFLDALTENQTVIDGQGLFAAIRRPVALESDQTPEYSDIRRSGHDGGDFLFARLGTNVATAPRPMPAQRPIATPRPAPATAQSQAGAAAETAFWNSIQDSKDPGDYQEYLLQFPKGVFAGLARKRVKTFKKQVANVVSPTARSPRQRFDGRWKATVSTGFAEAGCPMGAEFEINIQSGRLNGQHEGYTLSGTVTTLERSVIRLKHTRSF